jgi:hypothetical protein
MPIDPRGAVLGALAIAGAAAPAAAQAQAVRIENAAVRLVVIPEARSDVVFTIKPGRADLLPVKPRRDGGVWVLDGGYGGRAGVFGFLSSPQCHGAGEQASVGIPGRGRVPVADLPVVTVRTPLHAVVGAGGAIYGQVRASESLDLSLAGCGEVQLEDVKGLLSASVSGSGDVRGHGAGEARISISGSGDVVLGAVGALRTATSGSGNINVESVSGPIAAQLSGSGDLTVDHGAAPTVKISVAGSGNVRFGGSAGALSASVAGSGDVTVARVDGPVSRHVAGSGSVTVGGR